MKNQAILFFFLFSFASQGLYAQWGSNSTGIYYNTGNVSIGTTTTNSSHKLKVNGSAHFSDKVGLGTANPQTALHVKGEYLLNGEYVSSIFHAWSLFGGPTSGRIRGSDEGYIVIDGNPNGTGDKSVYLNYATNSNVVIARGGGKVGIGVQPDYAFHVKGDAFFENALMIGTAANAGYLNLYGNSHLYGNVNIGLADENKNLNVKGNSYITGSLEIGTQNANNYLNLFGNSYLYGNVSVGSLSEKKDLKVFGKIGVGLNPAYELDVDGIIRAKEIKVCLTQGCDFVFAPDYNLMPLDELGHFIQKNKHLPEVAPAATMESEGINVSEMNAMLLQKIEELTLYILSQNEKTKDLELKIEKMEDEMQLLKKN